MKIPMSILLDQLEQLGLAYEYKPIEDSPVFYNIAMMNNRKESYESDILYITNMQCLFSLPNNHLPSNILCVCNSEELHEKIRNSHANLIIVKSNIDVLKVYEEILSMVTTLNKWSESLINDLVNGKGVQSLTNFAHDIFRNPLMVVDSSFRLLAYTETDQAQDFTWKDSIGKGYVSISGTQFNDMQKFMKNTKDYQLLDFPSLNQPFLSTSIKIENRTIGYFSVLAVNTPITQRDIDLSSYFSMFLALEMQKKELVRLNKGIMYGNIIIELLDGKIDTKEDVEKRMRYLNWTAKKNLYVLTINDDSMYMSNDKLLSIRDQLSGIIHYCKCVIYSGNIVMLLERKTNHPFDDGDLGILSDFLIKISMHGGLSQCFHNIIEMPKFYKQSLKAIDIGRRIKDDNIIFKYAEYRLYHLVDILAEQEDIKDFCHPSLFKLMAYDEKNQTPFTATLFTYLACGKSPSETTKVLNLHRSSLSYRIKKIEEILNVDLNNNEEVFHLQLSFKLLNDSEISSFSI